MAHNHAADVNGHTYANMSDTPIEMKRTDPENGAGVTSQDGIVSPAAANGPRFNYLEGTPFWLVSACIAVMMFMTNFEVPVVTTALVAITNDLGGFENVGWVVAAYLLGYVAVIVIFAKFSDIFSRKIIFMVSTAVFIIFSAACAAAQTMVQLIVFRAFQGVGGGGCFSLCTIMVIEVVPPEKYAKFVANISIANALSLLLGPIIGGAIAANTTWRWIFIINIPIALPAFVIAWFAIPSDFPYQGLSNHHHSDKASALAKRSIGRIDFPGTVLILLATLGLTAGFEEAGRRFPWRSAYVISLLTISGVLWIILLLWERYVTKSNKVREPVLPWRFFKNREMMGILLNFLLLGGPTIIGMYLIPQRFQLVYQTSGLEAGVRLMPFTVCIPLGSIFASIVCGKHKVPALYLVIAGSALQVIGFACLGTLSTSLSVPSEIYGFQVLAGWGCGINFSLLFILIPHVNVPQDRAVAMGAGAQIRMIGSSVVLSIATSIFNTYAQSRIQELLGTEDSDIIISSGDALDALPADLQDAVRIILAKGYNRQMLLLCGSAALQIPASLLMWRKKNIQI